MSRFQLVLIVLVEVAITGLFSYHLSHGGLVSGSFELASFMMVLAVLFSRRSGHPGFNRLDRMQVALLAIVSVILLVFGIYHLSTPDGLRSGITELTSFTLLMIVFFYRGQK